MYALQVKNKSLILIRDMSTTTLIAMGSYKL